MKPRVPSVDHVSLRKKHTAPAIPKITPDKDRPHVHQNPKRAVLGHTANRIVSDSGYVSIFAPTNGYIAPNSHGYVKRTPPRHGTTPTPAATQPRGRPPPQRDPQRQPHREPRTMGQGPPIRPARQRSHSVRHHALPRPSAGGVRRTPLGLLRFHLQSWVPTSRPAKHPGTATCHFI